MVKSNNIQLENGAEIERKDFIDILNQGTKSGNFRFVKQICNSWLSKFPNDLAIECFLIRSVIFENEIEKTYELINNICEKDPEYLPAWELLAKVSSKKDLDIYKRVNTFLFALGKPITEEEVYPWGNILRETRKYLTDGKYDLAENKLNSILSEESSTPLIALSHLQLAKNKQDDLSFIQLAKIYHQRWPKCLQISLWLAESLLEQGEETESVSLLHFCAINDPAGEVANRLWGINHQFASIWPQVLSMSLDVPLPSQIAFPVGWNQLTAGDNYTSKDLSRKKDDLNGNPIVEKIKTKLKLKLRRPEKKEKLENKPIQSNNLNENSNIEDELNSIAQKSKKSRAKINEGKKPVYVVLSTKSGLNNKYGQKSTSIINDEIMKLTEIINLRPGWSSIAFIPDDINCMRMFELDEITEIDPWKIKLALVDLDKYLGEKGQMIGCVLIIGGTEVIPFHALPNPTDDKDPEVLSDNPYSTLDGNYFVPEWSVGRLPGEASNDPGLLLKQIRQIIEEHKGKYQVFPAWQNILNWILNLANIFGILKGILNKPQNYGYTASVWRRSSLAAFRPIGNGNNLRVSPPFNTASLDIELLKKSKYAYFNLHGLSDGPDWYGQKDINENPSEPDFPVAISSNQLKLGGSSPEIIFSEACYGAYINNKNADESIALRFRDIGSSVFIGSTSISYGSVSTPLIGADLLAFLFWKFLLEGYSAGEALMRSKVNFTEVMMQRQGYLDGEDQKTLCSFVYYGDPLARSDANAITMKIPLRSNDLLKISTVNDSNGVERKETRLSGDVLNNVKNVLKEYLPGIENAEVNIRHHQIPHIKVDNEFGSSSKLSNLTSDRVMISYCRPVIFQKITHYQYARVTLDNQGKMIKLAVSR
jgi:hypothetical protein